MSKQCSPLLSGRLLLALCSLLSALSASAEAIFIDLSEIDVATILPPPPEDTSHAGRADLETVWQLQLDRTPERIAQAEAVAHQDIFSFAGDVLGPWFTAENLPRTQHIFAVITQESYAVAREVKRHWQRPRPYVRDEGIIPIPRRSRSTSYPSGHASDAATWAVILDAAFPDFVGSFEDAVRKTMWGRVLGGSHYPTDTQAGRDLGRFIGQLMLEHPNMRTALQTIRDETAPFLAAVGAAGPAIGAAE